MNAMNHAKIIAGLLIAAFFSIEAHAALGADSAGGMTKVRMGLAARSTTSMPFFVAKERGFFREEGLDVELIVMQAIQTIQATMGKSLQFASATGSAVSAAVNGADIKVILAVTDRPSFDLIAQPNITSVQQLRGKKIGTGGVGSLAEILSRRILIANGVRPEEVTILATGPSHVTYVSLKAKVIDAAPLQMPLTFTAQDEGFRKLAAGADVIRALQGGLTTSKATINDRPELVMKMLRATQRALRLFRSDRRTAVEFIKGPFLELGKDRDRFAERIYDAALQYYLQSGVIDDKLQREMINVAAQRVKPKELPAPERVFDFSFAQKVSDSMK